MSAAIANTGSDAERYPIGKFVCPEYITGAEVEEWIGAIEALPSKLRKSLEPLSDIQLDTPYRVGGWTVRQVVHHLADSHMNSYMRFQLALTEDTPPIKLYDEKGWADLADAKGAATELSLGLLESLHARWALLLRSMTPEDWKRRFRHPKLGEVPLDAMLGLYAWHGRHHLAHIAGLRARRGW
jgi:hypothetical protein